MNIFKSFEIFLKEPLSILKKSIVQIVSINSPVMRDSGINVTLNDNTTQINVVNNDKVYKILKSVQQKREKIAAERLSIPEKRVCFGALTLKG